MTLSCADLRWDELISILGSSRGENLQGEDIQNMDFFTCCIYLNLNPVLLARHFQYRVETFFQVIVLDGPLGKVKYHAIWIEFQVRGSLHVHSFLWVLDAPILSKDNIDEYVLFVDSIVKATLPNFKVDPSLIDFVTTYQIHHTLGLAVNTIIRLVVIILVSFLQKKTIIAQPLPKEMFQE